MGSNKQIVEVLKGDITKIAADAIVNAANTSLLGGGGVDGAIHRAGGPEILAECRKIVARQGGCKVGEAVITSAGKLPAKYVIHTVGPVWNGGQKKESAQLAQCYRNALQLAINHDCRSIAFPSISTGIYKFPKDQAAQIAVDSLVEMLSGNHQLERIILVCFDDENYDRIKRYLQLKINNEQ